MRRTVRSAAAAVVVAGSVFAGAGGILVATAGPAAAATPFVSCSGDTVTLSGTDQVESQAGVGVSAGVLTIDGLGVGVQPSGDPTFWASDCTGWTPTGAVTVDASAVTNVIDGGYNGGLLDGEDVTLIGNTVAGTSWTYGGSATGVTLTIGATGAATIGDATIEDAPVLMSFASAPIPITVPAGDTIAGPTTSTTAAVDHSGSTVVSLGAGWTIPTTTSVSYSASTDTATATISPALSSGTSATITWSDTAGLVSGCPTTITGSSATCQPTEQPGTSTTADTITGTLSALGAVASSSGSSGVIAVPQSGAVSQTITWSSTAPTAAV